MHAATVATAEHEAPEENATGLKRARADLQGSVMWQAVQEQKRWIIALAIVGSLYVGNVVLVAVTIKSVFDDALINHTKALDPLVGNLVGLAVCSFVLGLAARMIGSRIVYEVEYYLRCWLYDRLQIVDPTAVEGLSAGQLVTRALTDLNYVATFAQVIPILLLGVLLVAAIAIVFIVINPLMGFLALVAMPINGYVVSKMASRLWGLSWLALNRRAQVTAAIDESVRGIRVVKAFGAEERAGREVARAAEGAYGVALSRIRLVARYGLIVKSVPVFFTAALVWVGAHEAIHGGFTIGGLVIFLGFGAFCTGLAAQFDEALSGWEYAKTGSGRILEMIATLPPPVDAARPLPAEREAGLLAVGAEVAGAAAPVSVEVRPGGCVALTGPVRATSTVATMLSGDLPLRAGSVTLEGVPLAELDPAARRAAIVVLGADPFLFGRTIRENVAVGARGRAVSHGEMVAAMGLAGAGELLELLPGGLDAAVGDRGMTLSGGQRQRVALARALVTPPRVLVLDDGLSAVDPALQATILRQLRRDLPQMAIVVISPRPLPAGIIDTTVDVTGADPSDADEAAGHSFDEPGTAELAAAVAAVDRDHERPTIPEADATMSDAPPTVANMLRPLTKPLASGIVALLAVTLFTILPDGVVEVIVNAVRRHTASGIGLAAVTIVPIGIGLSIATYFLRIELTKIDEGVLYLLRRRTFRRLTRMGVDFYDRELPGQVASRVVYDLDRITEFLDSGVFPLVTSVVLLFAAGALLYAVRPKIFFAVGPIIPAVAVFTAVEIPIAGRAYIEVRRRLGVVVERFHEDFLGRRAILTFGAEGKAREQFQLASRELRQSRRYATTVSNVYLSLVEGSTFLATAALVSVAGHLALKSHLSIGTLVFLEILLLQALAPIPALSAVLQTWLTARASFRTLSEPFVAPILPVERGGAAAPPAPLAGRMALDNVTFSYPGAGREVLHDVSLEIGAGENVAFVGPTGAGKSSVIKLLARVYDPDRGRVTVDGSDLASFALGGYRTRLGVVPQEPFCFRGTVRSNLLYGAPGASDDDIIRTIREIGVEESLLGLPGGLDAGVDEEGRNLSPTARQCIAIARAWLVAPDVLILDEATSCLPEPTEQKVLDAIAASGRTTVVVTHRVQVARWADRVIVVKDGAVAETGSHVDLFGRGALYSELFAT